MEGMRRYSSSSIPSAPSLHTLRHARRTALNYLFAAVYSCAVVVLLYHQAHRLVHSTTLASFFISLSLFLADTVLAFMWTTRQSFLVNIVYRDEHPGNLEEVLKKSDFPALDVFICTADPYKEPPMRLVSTALSVMAYDYPTEKISVYVSDDGGSQVTLYACMEAVKFASHWLPFCRKQNTAHRSPEAYFASNHSWSSDTEQIKIMYENMKARVEAVLERGKVEEYITEEIERRILSKWTDGFTRQDHPAVIEIMYENMKARVEAVLERGKVEEYITEEIERRILSKWTDGFTRQDHPAVIEVGFMYGSLVEDFYTGFRLQCKGWKSIFCNPKRPAFLGDSPISLIDVLNQLQRWVIGGLQVGFCRFTPITFGIKSMGPFMGLAYTHYCFWPIWCIPITIYAFLPQLALLNGLSIFPKIMYENMKARVETVLEKGKVQEEYITEEIERRILSKWTDGFTNQDHPAVIEVLLEGSKNRDITDHSMPNFIYVSREKSRTSTHNFKSGALNVMLRVSATMTNAPIILNIDCDMYSNDPQTPLRALCYLLDPKLKSQLAYVQFPQMFPGINKDDTYSCAYKRPFQINPMGLDGLSGPNYIGTGCFFNRQAFFGGPSTITTPEISQLGPHHVVDKPIQSPPTLDLAHKVAGCNYENKTRWGSEVGFMYGSLVEDFYTGFRLQCKGWKSIFCNPKRPAFLGDSPISLIDVLNQLQRWVIGGLQVGFCKFTPITFGIKSMGLFMGLAYTHYCFWPIWCIPITIYAFLPQLALLNGLSIFPKLSEPWFFLYVFLFLGAYGYDFLEFVVEGGTVQMWWNDQRMWMIRGLSCFFFAALEYFLKCLGISTYGFSVTSKMIDDEQSKRYYQGIFEFGVSSPMFVPLTMGAIINLVSFFVGLVRVLRGSNFEGLLLQMFIAGFAVTNALPIYEAMVLRSDKGRMPFKTTINSTCLALALYVLASLLLRD
ncbi:Cellulose synthase-like protein G3 [Morella rubra]|uniref:Cellulose synthase-like protein G3 n=1 Tax=Morella rubra TaxID=262757 RepID=A0A6A1UPW1_9ROSI|nr:Cellulose synthase-like protein G3 [Morella rubra]